MEGGIRIRGRGASSHAQSDRESVFPPIQIQRIRGATRQDAPARGRTDMAEMVWHPPEIARITETVAGELGLRVPPWLPLEGMSGPGRGASANPPKFGKFRGETGLNGYPAGRHTPPGVSSATGGDFRPFREFGFIAVRPTRLAESRVGTRREFPECHGQGAAEAFYKQPLAWDIIRYWTVRPLRETRDQRFPAWPLVARTRPLFFGTRGGDFGVLCV